MTITVSMSFLLLAGFSLILFMGVTWLAHSSGMFDSGGGGYAGRIEGFFILIMYAFLWAIPSLVVWAVWATWWRA